MKTLNIILIAILLISFICIALSLTTAGSVILGGLAVQFIKMAFVCCGVCVAALHVNSAIIEIREV